MFGFAYVFQVIFYFIFLLYGSLGASFSHMCVPHTVHLSDNSYIELIKQVFTAQQNPKTALDGVLFPGVYFKSS